MSITRKIYEDTGNTCTCFSSPPCTFCVEMTETEADVWYADGIQGLERLWERQDEDAIVQADETER